MSRFPDSKISRNLAISQYMGSISADFLQIQVQGPSSFKDMSPLPIPHADCYVISLIFWLGYHTRSFQQKVINGAATNSIPFGIKTMHANGRVLQRAMHTHLPPQCSSFSAPKSFVMLKSAHDARLQCRKQAYNLYSPNRTCTDGVLTVLS